MFYGTIVHSLSPSQLDVLQDAALFVNKETGIITALETDLKSEEALQAAIKRQCGDGDVSSVWSKYQSVFIH